MPETTSRVNHADQNTGQVPGRTVEIPVGEYMELVGDGTEWNDPNPEKLWMTHNLREFSDRAMRCAMLSGHPHYQIVGVMHEMYRVAWIDNACLRGKSEQIAGQIAPAQSGKSLKPLVEAVLKHDGWSEIQNGYQHKGLLSALGETLQRVDRGKRRAQKGANARWHKAALNDIEAG